MNSLVQHILFNNHQLTRDSATGYLRMGKRTLKEKNGESALTAFNKAIDAIATARKAGGFDNYQ